MRVHTQATHLDGVYFKGATRFQFPQWLLAAMKFSQLWEDDFVDQVQVVAYYHEWEDEDRGGLFALWDDNAPPKFIQPVSCAHPSPCARASVFRGWMACVGGGATRSCMAGDLCRCTCGGGVWDAVPRAVIGHRHHGGRVEERALRDSVLA